MAVFVPVRRRPKRFLRIEFMAVPTAVGTWTDMPLAEAFFMSSANSIQFADLRGFKECRMLVTRKATAGTANAAIFLKRAATFSTTVGDYADLGTTSVTIDVTTASIATETAWTPIVLASRATGYIAVTGSGGDGSADPQFGYLAAEFR